MNAIVAYEEIGSPLSVETVKHQIQVIQEIMEHAMVKDTHYGIIPGCGDKPTLLKAGAEKLSLTFRLSPTYVVTKTELGGGHREYEVRCTLTHIPSGRIFGEGVGTCSTQESKYRYRKSERVCPKCESNAIIKGKAEYGGGWLCFAKKGGCGAKFKDDDPLIVEQHVGRVENPDIADVYNTVLKIGKKRSHIDAILTAVAASDIFAQDLEDLPHAPEVVREAAPEPPRQNEPPLIEAEYEPVKLTENVKNNVHDKTLLYLQSQDAAKMQTLWQQYDADQQVALWSMFNSTQRSAIKKLIPKKEGT